MDLAWAAVNAVIDLLSTPCLVQRRRRQSAHKDVARRMERLVLAEISRVEREKERVCGYRETHRLEAEANRAAGASQLVQQSDQQRADEYENMLRAFDAKLNALQTTRLSITTNLEFKGTVAETMSRYQAVVGHLAQMKTESQLSGLANNLKGLLEQSDYAGAVTKEILSKGLDGQIEEPALPAKPTAGQPEEKQSLLGGDDGIQIDEEFLNDDSESVPIEQTRPTPSAPAAPATQTSSSSSSSSSSARAEKPPPRKHPGLTLKNSDIYKFEQPFLQGKHLTPPPLMPGMQFRKMGRVLA